MKYCTVRYNMRSTVLSCLYSRGGGILISGGDVFEEGACCTTGGAFLLSEKNLKN